MSNSEVWNQILAGRRDALSTLFKEMYMPMLNYGSRFTADRSKVKDCIHDVFVHVWSRRNKLSPIDNVKAYLFTALRMRIIELGERDRARTRRQQSYATESWERMLNIEQITITEELEQQEREQLQQAVDNLTKRQREVVYLKFFNGFSNDEIAAIMQVNKQSVYNLVSGALKNLEGYLQ